MWSHELTFLTLLIGDDHPGDTHFCHLHFREQHETRRCWESHCFLLPQEIVRCGCKMGPGGSGIKVCMPGSPCVQSTALLTGQCHHCFRGRRQVRGSSLRPNLHRVWAGKAREGRVNTVQDGLVASFQGLWLPEARASCLVPGCTCQAEEGWLWFTFQKHILGWVVRTH